jgi:hypothetical protein
MDGITPIRGLLAMLAVALLSAAAGASASGARQGVKAQPGEIVLLRDVAARPAYRMAPPGMALIADPNRSARLRRRSVRVPRQTRWTS